MHCQGSKHSVATEYTVRMLGLDICADTMVGNELIRGISGGQKKRVTSGEMVVGSKKARSSPHSLSVGTSYWPRMLTAHAMCWRLAS